MVSALCTGCFVLVESLSETMMDASFPGDSTTNTASPFQSKTLLQCAMLLRRLRNKTSSDINFEYFAILDDRSVEDKTVLVVEAIRADEYGSDGDANDDVESEDSDSQALRI
jgi:hypothetical protein